MTDPLISFQQRLGHEFRQPDLLVRALTHRSFSADHNERLEFLGDSVLGLAVSTVLYAEQAGLTEGDLSRGRANLVRQDTLHQLALGLGLSPLLRLGEGEAKSGGAKRASILADALEALVGAVYLDADYEVAAALVRRLYQTIDFRPQLQAASKDAKTELQEWLQGRKMALPQYRVIATLGAAHQQTFDVECLVEALQASERGLGGSRRAAEQAAASAMLHTLKSLPA